MQSNTQQRLSSFISYLSSSPFLLLAFSVFALAPLTAPGYFIYAHDARHWVYFLQMFDAAFRDGAWYPRWAADMTFGYGYPLWVIYAPLPMYLGEIFRLVGFDFVSAVKIVDGLALFCSALTMYLFASRVLGKPAGFVAGIAYVYIPYHLADLYVRAAQGELVSFVFPPLVCWAFYELAMTREARYILLAALSYAALILSHISMAVIFTPIMGLYLLFLLITVRPPSHTLASVSDNRDTDILNRRDRAIAGRQPLDCLQFTFYASVAIALALGMAAVFLLPAIFEQKYLTSDPFTGGFFNYREHFLNANQLLAPFWGYGYAGENGADQFSLQLGLIPTLLAIVALGAIAKAREATRAHIAVFAVIASLIVFLMLPVSAPLWEPFAAVLGFVQFPWRLLTVTTFALAFLSGASLCAFTDDGRDFAPALVMAFVFVVASYAYTQPQSTDAVFNYQTQMEFETQYGELLGDTIWMTGERPKDSPLVEQYINGEKLQKAIALDDRATVETIRYSGQSTDLRVNASAPTRVMVYTRYFPGWTATIDDQRVEPEPVGDQGLILVRVPVGSHVVRLRFEDTPIRQIGAVISALSVVFVIGWMFKLKGN